MRNEVRQTLLQHSLAHMCWQVAPGGEHQNYEEVELPWQLQVHVMEKDLMLMMQNTMVVYEKSHLNDWQLLQHSWTVAQLQEKHMTVLQIQHFDGVSEQVHETAAHHCFHWKIGHPLSYFSKTKQALI